MLHSATSYVEDKHKENTDTGQSEDNTQPGGLC